MDYEHRFGGLSKKIFMKWQREIVNSLDLFIRGTRSGNITSFQKSYAAAFCESPEPFVEKDYFRLPGKRPLLLRKLMDDLPV